jgi:Flp pilus assembly protein TadD
LHFNRDYRKEADSSIAIYEEILKRTPNDKDALMKLGCLFHRQFHFEKAIEIKLKAASISPKDAEVMFSLGCSYCAKGDFSAAIKCYAKAVELRPDYLVACEALAEQYQLTGQRAKADEWTYKSEKLKLQNDLLEK